ncbi:MAG: class I SAM-dependent methyltransferase [Alphaproteobacteria bacterium]|nr:class I SAM-dependent methyltransferase [Alphaproteobacteria bacterium]
MRAQASHAVLPRTTHDELARQNFVQSMRTNVTGPLTAGNRIVFEQHAKPLFRREHDREPVSRTEVGSVMRREPYYQAWSALMRTTQEMLWDSVGDSVERQLPELIARARRPSRRTNGSLTLDPALAMPRYIEAVDIHVMPGNFQTETTTDDVYAGALYDRGVYVFLMGNIGSFNEGLGSLNCEFLKSDLPEFRPRRILDMGCSVGHSTLPYVDAFPDAEVYGLDVGAPMLRYAHARSQSLGKRVHWVQMDATATTFPDGHFDLVVSHLLLHECPQSTIRSLFRESHRLLASGGIMLHSDAPKRNMTAYDEWLMDWNTHYNNEPFARGSRDLDFEREALAAGFRRENLLTFGRKALYLAEMFRESGARGARKA